MGVARVQVFVATSYSSAEARRLALLSSPPTTSTFPVSRTVAVKLPRGVFIDAAADHWSGAAETDVNPASINVAARAHARRVTSGCKRQTTPERYSAPHPALPRGEGENGLSGSRTRRAGSVCRSRCIA